MEKAGPLDTQIRGAIPRAETSFEPGFMKSGELPRGETGDEIESNYPDATGLPALIGATQQKMDAMKFVDIGHKLNCKVRNEK